MNATQIHDVAKQGLMILGTIATTFGWLTPDKVAGYTATILSILGPISMIAAVIWGQLRGTKVAILNAAASIPEVTAIAVTPVTGSSTDVKEAGRLIDNTRPEVKPASVVTAGPMTNQGPTESRL